MSSVLEVESRKLSWGSVEFWTVNRPEKLNALNSKVLQELDQHTLRLENQLKVEPMSVRALIVRGAGDKAFVAGADIAEMEHFTPDQAADFSRLGSRAMSRLEELPVPVIAMVQGFCLGGGLELAMACDFRLAAEKAQFGQPEVLLGLIPGFGATLRFAEKLGQSRALEFFLNAQRIPAREAMQMGLVDRVVSESTDLESTALDWAQSLCVQSTPSVIGVLKKLLWKQPERLRRLEDESVAFGQVFASTDKKEGVRAFLEKRKPQFQGH